MFISKCMKKIIITIFLIIAFAGVSILLFHRENKPELAINLGVENNNHVEHNTHKYDVAPANDDSISGEITAINIKNLGAVGDGVSDDYKAFYNGLNIAKESGLPLYLPKGEYYISTKLVIDGNVWLEGEDANDTKIVFRDKSYNCERPELHAYERGMITFNGGTLIIKNVSLRYEANNYNPYTRNKKENSGVEGVLLSVLKADKIVFDNDSFYVGGELNPSVTCVWLKSELEDICNVSITECFFENASMAYVGGCLWMSAHDNEATSLSNVEVNNNKFIKNGNDEVLSVWGYNVHDISIENNYFEYDYEGVINDVFISFGMPEYLDGIDALFFKKNFLYIKDGCRMGIKVQKLTPDSSILIADNQIIGALEGENSFTNFVFMLAGNVDVYNNIIEVTGGNIITFIDYSLGGRIESVSNRVTVKDSKRGTVINSWLADYFDEAHVSLQGDAFEFATTNDKSEMPVIQFPDSGLLKISNCNFDYSASKTKEVKLQTLYCKGKESSGGQVELLNNTFSDGMTFIVDLVAATKRKFEFIDNNFDKLLFIIDENKAHFGSLYYKNNTSNVFINYKAMSLDAVAEYCDRVEY